MILPFSIYIIKCNNGHYYTGFTRNINQRLSSHKEGKVSYTKDKLPVKLVHVSQFIDVKKAYDFERYLKSGSGMAFRNKRLL
ncbi:GIY-YIG nuclease family protein [Muriicola sp.]|uniref:GIY-YIG nuclease family protein n=1 Tax=Muriicola sp. TaxID=2020856 RepID=UPI003C77D82E